MTRYTTKYDPLFEKHVAEFFAGGIDWRVIKAQAIAESGLDPMAVSPAGARGMMQIMPATGEWIARRLGVTWLPFLPELSIRVGIAYDLHCFKLIKKAGALPGDDGLDQFRLMFGAYNAGPGNILKAAKLARELTWAGVRAHINKVTGGHAAETINYVARIEREYRLLARQQGEGME